MTRLQYLLWKHQKPKTETEEPLIENILSKEAPPPEVPRCGDCRNYLNRNECPKAEYKKIELNKAACFPTDSACEQFQPKPQGEGRQGRESRAKKGYTLDLNAEIPETLTPCGFTGSILTECAWLPYRDKDDNIEPRPSVIMVEKVKPPQIIDFLNQNPVQITGVFPSQDLKTLMSIDGVKKLMLKNYRVDPHVIDSEIDQAFKRHLDMPTPEKIVCKRWLEATYSYDIFDSLPLLNVLGVSESGKSRLCLLASCLAYHGEIVINPSEAAIFRGKHEDKISQIYDEAEYLRHPQLYSVIKLLLNASYSKDAGYVSRYDEDSEGRRVKKRFDLYSPMLISGISGLSAVTASRAIKIVMKRAKKDYPKAKHRDYKDLRDQLYILRIRHAFEIRELYEKTDISHIVSGRFEELFKPIFAMTKFMGTKEEQQILEKWCKTYEDDFRVENLNTSEEETVITCLAKLQTENKAVMPNWYQIKDLCNLVAEEVGKQVTSKHVSSILYRLGLTRRKKVKGYTLVYASPELLEESAGRIGISISGLPTPQSLPTPPEPNENWLNQTLKDKR